MGKARQTVGRKQKSGRRTAGANLTLSFFILWVKNMPSKKKKGISECFKPDPKLAKTSMDGRVIYEDVDMSCLSGNDMRETGETIAKAFPSFTVWVTGGPYRFYDVRHAVDVKKKIISIDFYSVRPGFSYIPEIVMEIQEFLKKKNITP